jgi:hypothetical protein
LLFEGSIDDATESFDAPYGSPGFQSAYYWWPEDRAWCVATEIDLMEYVRRRGEALRRGHLQTPGIEALRANIDHRITGAADTINPNPFRE